jgi:hypothetical protein
MYVRTYFIANIGPANASRSLMDPLGKMNQRELGNRQARVD